MAIDPITGLAIAGIGSSLLGGIFGSRAASGQAAADRQAAEDARNFQSNRNVYAQLSALTAAMGPQAARQYLQGVLSPQEFQTIFGRQATAGTLSDRDQSMLAWYNDRLDALRNPRNGIVGGSQNMIADLERRRDELQRKLVGDPGQAPGIDLAAFDAMGPGYISELQGLTDRFDRLGSERMRQFETHADRISADAAGTESLLKGYLNQEEADARRDADRSLKGSNRLLESRLVARGLGGSSTHTRALSDNSRAHQESLASTLGGIGTRRVGTLAGLRQAKTGLDTSLLGTRTNLAGALDQQSMALNQAPLQLKANLLSSPVMSPWLGVDATRYFSTASPSAAGMASIGNSLSAFGGQASNMGMLSMLYGQGSRGGGGMRTSDTYSGQAGGFAVPPAWQMMDPRANPYGAMA